MSEAADRVEAWRRAKRQAGYRPMLLWFPIEFKSELDGLAYARRQDPAAYVMAAVRAFAASQGQSTPLRLDPHEVYKLKEEIAAYVLRRMTEPGTPASPDAPQAPASSPTAQPPRPKTGGKPGIPDKLLTALCDVRRQYPALSLAKLAQHLYDAGIYRATSREGASVPANPGTLKLWFDQAKARGLL